MPAPRLPAIAVLATGGTIAGVQSEQASAAYRAGALDVSELLAAVPGLGQLAHIRSEQVASVGTRTISFAVWSALGAPVRGLAKDPAGAGMVIPPGPVPLERPRTFLGRAIPTAKPACLQ